MDASLKRAIASELREEPEALTGDRTLASIDGWDSIVALSIMVIVGDACGLKVAPPEMFKLKTFGDLDKLVADLEGRGDGAGNPWRRLAGELIAQAGDPVAEAIRLLRASGPLDVDSQLFVAEALHARNAGGAQLDAFPIVAAQLAALRGDFEVAVAALDRRGRDAGEATAPGDQTHADLDPWRLGLRARWLVRLGRHTEAAADLRLALSLDPAAAWFARHERVLAAVLDSEWPARRDCRIALLSSGTTATLIPTLRAVLFRDGIRTQVYEGPFGNLRQDILDDESGLYMFRPDIVVMLTNHHDLALPPRGGTQLALAFADEMAGLWKTLQAKLPCHVVHATVDLPADGSGGLLEDAGTGRRVAILACNQRLAELAPAGVSLLAAGDWLSRGEWDATKQYPAQACVPELANAVAGHVRAVLGLTAKVLVLDLDNTLWGGVVGEDGVAGILVGPPSAEGEGYVALQKFAKELKDRGVLLAAVSKNNPADAEEPFKTHDAMALKLDDFVAFHASWSDKASAIKAIADELSLGLDAFVLLDDNPLERAWVRRELPMVAVPEVAADPWAMRRALARGRYFEAIAVTSEDLERSASYRATSAIKGAGSVEDFLHGLDMTVEHGPFEELVLPRVTQLVNKTNQFNLTTRRLTLEQVRRLATSPDHWCRWFRVSDRFGDHGLVGVLIVDKTSWTVDSWLMSCRVLGRRMEDFMIATALDAAAKAGATRLVGEYIPTAKNELVRELYPKLGFSPHDEAGAARRYVFALDGRPLPSAPWIRAVAR